MKESDLYLPLKQFLETQHYEVKGEVQDCDVVAVRGDEAPVVVDLSPRGKQEIHLWGEDAEGTKRRRDVT